MASAFAGPDIAPGVTQDLARWRAAHYRDVAYALEFELRAGAEAVDGRVEVRVSFRGEPVDLVLDWRGGPERLRDLRLNGRAFDGARYEAEHLIIPRRLLARGSNRLAMGFRAPVSTTGGPVTRFKDGEDEYWYTLFVPAEVHSVFPCFDQPDLKARFRLELVAPAAWRTVSNAPLAGSETRTVAGVPAQEAQRRDRFAATVPISPYLFAFAAGPFAEFHETKASQPGPVRLLARRSQTARAAGEANAMLELNRAALEWFSRYFDQPYPFAKYDLVLIPELPYGGMEHAGATFLREESVLFPTEPSSNDLQRRALLVLHETSHQWFGDLVTMRWFDDLWLKEGFASFMAAKAAAALLPQRLPGAQPWITFHALKTAAYRTDATRGTTPIWQAMANVDAAKSAYGNIVYAKAPAVLRQAEHFVGEQAFARGVRDFLRRHAYGAAGWNDLVRALSAASGRKLDTWADAWVTRRGMPRIRVQRQAAGITLIEEDVLGEGGFWPMRVQLVTLDAELSRRDVWLRGVRTEVALAEPAAPVLFANDGDYGYGQFLLDDASRERVLADAASVALPQDDLLRALLLDSLWESVREAELDPARYLDLVLEWLPHERDDTTASQLLARLSAAYLRYLRPERRGAFTQRVERLLEGEMHQASTLSRRIAYFRAFIDTARSEKALERLKLLLAGRERIEGLALRSRDRFAIAEALLARGDAEAPTLLASLARDDASPEGRRYAFGAVAARPDEPAKRSLFERFIGDPQLPESWVVEALGPFNELDQSLLTEPLLLRALEALPRLKNEQRIFFVNDWLAAFIGGQSSPDALAAVKTFLARRELEPDLERKVLEALDTLERTVSIRRRFP